MKHNHDYKQAAQKFDITYSRAYAWTQKTSEQTIGTAQRTGVARPGVRNQPTVRNSYSKRFGTSKLNYVKERSDSLLKKIDQNKQPGGEAAKVQEMTSSGEYTVSETARAAESVGKRITNG
ncbi:hypothetical protein ACW2AE_06800 [Limosilactobacillus fermentum]